METAAVNTRQIFGFHLPPSPVFTDLCSRQTASQPGWIVWTCLISILIIHCLTLIYLYCVLQQLTDVLFNNVWTESRWSMRRQTDPKTKIQLLKFCSITGATFSHIMSLWRSHVALARLMTWIPVSSTLTRKSRESKLFYINIKYPGKL